MYPLVKELAADGVPVVGRVPGAEARPPAHHRWLTHPIGSRELDQAYLANAVFDAHRDDPEFGYRPG
ncbi:hypothetical protein ATK74_1243 [Propionicimonas paludicola]|uniref:Uncharacterized protein n=1 Tax=Propionicimonas paludicola TaxID=185243 RepID=A0A2A9CR75_9ACTN|nr:hypothetical protein ATK74_1243 [Propionicimonas paludicola]